MDICKKLQMAKRDEAGGILLYNKIKSEMPPEHTEHIDEIDQYIGDEYDHLQGVGMIIKEMGCKDLTPIDEVCIIAKEILERADEMERTAKAIENKDVAENIHKITEVIEMKVIEIYSILKKHPTV